MSLSSSEPTLGAMRFLRGGDSTTSEEPSQNAPVVSLRWEMSLSCRLPRSFLVGSYTAVTTGTDTATTPDAIMNLSRESMMILR